MKRLSVVLFSILLSPAVLVACGQDKNSAQKIESQQAQPVHQDTSIKKPIVPGTDASTVAKESLTYLKQTEPQLNSLGQPNEAQLEALVFSPVRDLLVHWRLDVKQSDSVVGDQYTICRGALMSFDAWARSLIEQPTTRESKKQVYIKQKEICEKRLNS